MKLIEAEQRNQDELDGDFYSHYTPDNKSHFMESGILEADCMICHKRNYNFGDRIEQIISRNYKWAATAGAGIGKIEGKIFEYSDMNTRPDSPDFWNGNWNFEKRPVVAYNWQDRSIFTDAGKLRGPMITKFVSSENCLQCHKGPDSKKVGWIHSAEYDVHVKAGFECIDCHPLVGNTKKQRLQHQIAKGWHPSGSVRDDLDGKGMRTCQSCHIEGKYKPTRAGLPAVAKNPSERHVEKYEDVEFHFDIISCEGCHAVRQPAKGGYLIDMSTGSQVWYTASALETIVWSGDFALPAQKRWEPWLLKYDVGSGEGEKYISYVPKIAQWFGQKFGAGEIRPIRLEWVKSAYEQVDSKITTVKVNRVDGKTVARSTVATDNDISLMLHQLQKHGFPNAVFVREKVYELLNGKLFSYEDLHATHAHIFPVHHNIVPISDEATYGHDGIPSGCADCHSKTAPFFTKMIIKNPGGFLKYSYPNPKEPYAIPLYKEFQLEEVPESGFEEEQ
ncbi:hypothetical protein JXJ21_13640 [candidate division KSB1 bacterium]|nr:hypothetical protein [candidate division KSB1 bacterium]